MTGHLNRELWLLPGNRHPGVRDDLVVVEHLAGEQPDAARDGDHHATTAHLAEPSEELRRAAVSVARGPRAGARIGEFPLDRRALVGMTSHALAALARTVELPPSAW